MSRLGKLGAGLYSGKVAYDFIGKRKVWYTISAILVLVSILALVFLKLTLGVEFKGGAVYTVQTTGSVEQARQTTADAGISGAIVTQVNGDKIRVTTEPISTEESQKLQNALAKTFNVAPEAIDVQVVGPSWGSQITK